MKQEAIRVVRQEAACPGDQVFGDPVPLENGGEARRVDAVKAPFHIQEECRGPDLHLVGRPYLVGESGDGIKGAQPQDEATLVGVKEAGGLR